jgi:hypothetical protein
VAKWFPTAARRAPDAIACRWLGSANRRRRARRARGNPTGTAAADDEPPPSALDLLIPSALDLLIEKVCVDPAGKSGTRALNRVRLLRVGDALSFHHHDQARPAPPYEPR